MARTVRLQLRNFVQIVTMRVTPAADRAARLLHPAIHRIKIRKIEMAVTVGDMWNCAHAPACQAANLAAV